MFRAPYRHRHRHRRRRSCTAAAAAAALARLRHPAFKFEVRFLWFGPSAVNMQSAKIPVRELHGRGRREKNLPKVHDDLHKLRCLPRFSTTSYVRTYYRR